MRAVHQGLGILLKYVKELHPQISAGHDVIRADGPAPDEGVSEADVIELERLGWRWDESEDCWRKLV
jgi:hypothetical protein